MTKAEVLNDLMYAANYSDVDFEADGKSYSIEFIPAEKVFVVLGGKNEKYVCPSKKELRQQVARLGKTIIQM